MITEDEQKYIEFDEIAKECHMSRCCPVFKNFAIVVSPDGDGSYDIIHEEPNTYHQFIKGKEIVFERIRILDGMRIRDSMLFDLDHIIDIHYDKITLLDEKHRAEFLEEINDESGRGY